MPIGCVFQLNCVEEAQNKHGLLGAHGHVYTILIYLFFLLVLLCLLIFKLGLNCLLLGADNPNINLFILQQWVNCKGLCTIEKYTREGNWQYYLAKWNGEQWSKHFCWRQ